MNFYHQLFSISISCIHFHSMSDFFLYVRRREKLHFHYFGIYLTSKFYDITSLFVNCIKTGERTNLDERPPHTLLCPFLYRFF